MLAWSSSSDFPGPGEARWSQVKPGGLSQCCWLPVLQTGGAKHAEPQSPIQPTLEGWKCGNFYDSHYSEGNVSTQEWKHKESEKFFAHEGFVPS